MAFLAVRPSVVGNAPAVLIAFGGGPSTRNTRVEVNNTSVNPVYIGGSTAATASVASRTVPTLTAVTFELRPGESMYAFATTTSTIEVTADGQ